ATNCNPGWESVKGLVADLTADRERFDQLLAAQRQWLDELRQRQQRQAQALARLQSQNEALARNEAEHEEQLAEQAEQVARLQQQLKEAQRLADEAAAEADALREQMEAERREFQQ